MKSITKTQFLDDVEFRPSHANQVGKERSGVGFLLKPVTIRQL